MLANIKHELIGLTITDAGLVNKGGERHIRILFDTGDKLLVPLDDVMVTLAERKPPASASSLSSFPRPA